MDTKVVCVIIGHLFSNHWGGGLGVCLGGVSARGGGVGGGSCLPRGCLPDTPP